MSITETRGTWVARVSRRGGTLTGMAKEAGVAVPEKDVAVRRVTLAGRLAAELGELPAAVWQQRATGSVESFPARISDDVEVSEVIAQAWDLTLPGVLEPSASVQTRTGAAGVVIVAHGAKWSLVARSGGPVLILSDRIAGVVRVDLDPESGAELAALVSALANVGRGLPARDEAALEAVWESMPRLPWHPRP